MSEISHGYSIDDALARNNEVFEVEFERWGTRLHAPSAVWPEPNLQWPPPGSRPIPSSVAAVAIGPRSTIDRCWISWDRQKILTIPVEDNLDPNAVVNVPRIVTIDAPLLFPQATMKGPTLSRETQSWWDAMQFGTAYVFPWGPRPGQNSLGQGQGNQGHGGAYGTTTGFYVSQTYVSYKGETLPFTPLEEPFLHLLLYTKLPAFAPASKRAAMLRETTWSVGEDDFVALYPIFGRKHVNVSLISHNFNGIPANIVDCTLGLIRNVNENPVGSFSPLFEVKAAEALAIPADTGVNLPLSNPCADYLVVHIHTEDTPAGGAVTIVAED